MATVALVVGDNTSLNVTDTLFKTLLETDLGHTVTVIDDSTAEDKNYDLIVISESVTSTNLLPSGVEQYFPDTAGDPPVILTEQALTDDWGITTAGTNAQGSQDSVDYLTGADTYINWTGQATNTTVVVLDTAREFYMIGDGDLNSNAISLVDNTANTGSYVTWLPTGTSTTVPSTTTAPIVWFGLAGANATLPATDANAAYEQLFKDIATELIAGQTVSVHKTTGEYSTVQAALDAADVTNGYWRVMITDAALYTESIDVDTITGTPNINRYVWLTAASNVRHGGDQGVGARIDSTAGNVFTLANGAADFFRCDWLEIKINNSNNSAEAFRLDPGVENVLISHCIIWTNYSTSANDQDGIYMTTHSSTNSLSVDNCVFSGWQRAGINVQQFGASTGNTYTLNVDHCSFYKNGDFGAAEAESAAISVTSDDADDVIVVNMYNTAAGGTTNGGSAERDFVDGPEVTLRVDRTAPTGSVTWNGSHNLTAYPAANPLTDIDGTNNITDWQEAISGISGTSQTSGSYWVIATVDDTNPIDSYDLRPLNDTDAGNLVLGNGIGVGVSGYSEPDARQDFSIDIAGNYRPTTSVDIGAYQLSQQPAIVQNAIDYDNTPTAGTSFTTSWGSATTADNMLFAIFGLESGAADASATVTTPSGWTKIGDAEEANRGCVVVFAKVAAGSDSDVTVTWSTANDHPALAIVEVSGLDSSALTGGDYLVGTDASVGSTDTGATIASFSAQNFGDALFYGFYGKGLNYDPLTLPTGWTEGNQAGGSNTSVSWGYDLDGGVSTPPADYDYTLSGASRFGLVQWSWPLEPLSTGDASAIVTAINPNVTLPADTGKAASKAPVTAINPTITVPTELGKAASKTPSTAINPTGLEVDANGTAGKSATPLAINPVITLDNPGSSSNSAGPVAINPNITVETPDRTASPNAVNPSITVFAEGIGSAGNATAGFDAINPTITVDTPATASSIAPVTGIYPRVAADFPGSSGDYAWTEDSVTNSVTGDIDVRVHVALDDWASGVAQVLMGKRNGSTNKSWQFQVGTTGRLVLNTTTNGSTDRTAVASTQGTYVNGEPKWVRATLDVSAGDTYFYESDDGTSWTQIGNVQAGAATSIFDSTAHVTVGAYQDNGSSLPATGTFYSAEFLDGIDGSVAASFNPALAGTETTWPGTLGETWDLGGSAAISFGNGTKVSAFGRPGSTVFTTAINPTVTLGASAIDDEFALVTAINPSVTLASLATADSLIAVLDIEPSVTVNATAKGPKNSSSPQVSISPDVTLIGLGIGDTVPSKASGRMIPHR